MADAASARREARRRKILENSHNRLQIISGKSSDECVKESLVRTVAPEQEYDFSAAASSSSYSSSSQQNGVLFSPPSDLFEFLSSAHASGDGELPSDLASLLPPIASIPPTAPMPLTSESAEVATLSTWEKIIANKYDVVLLSLIFQILYSLSLIKFDNSNFFLPIIVYIVTKLIWFPTQISSNIANMLLLLNGMSPERIQKVLYLSQCIGVISRDIFVYLFTTICVQAFWKMLMDYLVT